MPEASGDPRDRRRAPTHEVAPPRERGSVLPSTPSDESPEGWGDRRPDGGGAADPDSDDERFLRERPPHHEG